MRALQERKGLKSGSAPKMHVEAKLWRYTE